MGAATRRGETLVAQARGELHRYVIGVGWSAFATPPELTLTDVNAITNLRSFPIDSLRLRSAV